MITLKTPFVKAAFNALISKKEPISIVHFLTNRCNARCSFCFIDFENPEIFKKELSLNEIEKLTKNLGNSILNVNFTGGEPFARKDIQEIAELYIKNTTIQSIYITTNGSLPDRIESFAKNISFKYPDIELTFQISIDDFPNKHDKVRKITGLFDNCIKSYNKLKKIEGKINPVVSITVSDENYSKINEIYDYLTINKNINSLKCTIVRDEGVFKTPLDKKEKILNAYNQLTNKIKTNISKKKIKNYDSKSLQGRLHNKKEIITWDLVKKIYMDSDYISPCHAGSLFGIISSDGSVFPCEILEKKKLGNLRDNEMNFMKIWNNTETKNVKKFIKKTNCACSYECALTYNILGNWRYQPSLLFSALFD